MTFIVAYKLGNLNNFSIAAFKNIVNFHNKHSYIIVKVIILTFDLDIVNT